MEKNLNIRGLFLCLLYLYIQINELNIYEALRHYKGSIRSFYTPPPEGSTDLSYRLKSKICRKTLLLHMNDVNSIKLV